MSSNAKIVLRKKPNSKGLYPLAIRITKNRRSTYQYVGHYIDLEDWDEKNIRVRKSNPNADSLNKLLSKELSNANKALIDLQSEHKDASANQIKKEIYASGNSSTFFELAQEHLDELEIAKKLNRLSTDSALISYIIKFNKSKQLAFQEIDERFLKKLMLHLKSNHGLSETSVMNVLVLIRLLFNRAIKLKIVSRELYPFGGDKIKIKFPETSKVGLNIIEVRAIEALENLTLSEVHTRNVWLFSFNFAGMRVTDVLLTKWSDIYDKRLHYRMNKNSKLLSLKIPDKVFKILDYYRKDKRYATDFVFPELKKANLDNAKDVYNKRKTATKKFNDNLKSIAKKAKIDKKITMHIARHTFGNIAGDTIHPLMLQKLYRHSDLKTTLNYQANFIHKEADDALNSVVNF
ncbi:MULTISPECIES: site-specific integrase [Flavobacteriaceae]|uniref:site-specific integrase n=1 Tax=Flavobacteriaceae TaxID=49546 RepID=UPI0023507254|nr:site-specific integrase [Altibacter sp. HG106]MDC7994196.1 site-specific integrase [Altibacter sp. HG106]|tara:strand:- start:2858 stop:4072 length:1215 start_codon:yes stop_codon:yes gene_type:complete